MLGSIGQEIKIKYYVSIYIPKKKRPALSYPPHLLRVPSWSVPPSSPVAQIPECSFLLESPAFSIQATGRQWGNPLNHWLLEWGYTTLCLALPTVESSVGSDDQYEPWTALRCGHQPWMLARGLKVDTVKGCTHWSLWFTGLGPCKTKHWARTSKIRPLFFTPWYWLSFQYLGLSISWRLFFWWSCPHLTFDIHSHDYGFSLLKPATTPHKFNSLRFLYYTIHLASIFSLDLQHQQLSNPPTLTIH